MFACSLKRLKYELKYFDEKKYFIENNLSNNDIIFLHNIKLENHIENKHGKDYHFLNIYYINNLLFSLNIPYDFPFKPYMVQHHPFSNTISYHRYLNILSNDVKKVDINILKFFYKCMYLREGKFLGIKNPSCYCCSSIICSGNWSPSHKINTFIQEYLEFRFIDKYTRRLQYRNIYNIYNNIFNNLFQKLPDDIVCTILSKI